MWKTKFKRCIHTSPSGYRVYQNVLYRWLTFSGEEYQTILNRRNPESPELSYIRPLTLPARLQRGSCCLMGIGGASVLHLLSYHQAYDSMTALDSSLEVIDIAKKYFLLNNIPDLEVLHDSAEHYIQNIPQAFHHLIIDIYHHDTFPEACLNLEFFEQCKKALLSGGTLSINIANRNEQHIIFQYFKSLFGHNTLVIPLQNCANMIIIASDNREFIDKKVRYSQELEQMQWVNPWGHVGWVK